jgi:hypothetical protein
MPNWLCNQGTTPSLMRSTRSGNRLAIFAAAVHHRRRDQHQRHEHCDHQRDDEQRAHRGSGAARTITIGDPM